MKGGADDKPESMQNVTIELGAEKNPPGFDDNLARVRPDDVREFTVDYASDYQVQELAGATVDYLVTVKAIRKKELLPLDDAFAKEVSHHETLEALRDQIREDLQRGAEQESEHK